MKAIITNETLAEQDGVKGIRYTIQPLINKNVYYVIWAYNLVHLVQKTQDDFDIVV